MSLKEMIIRKIVISYIEKYALKLLKKIDKSWFVRGVDLDENLLAQMIVQLLTGEGLSTADKNVLREVITEIINA